MGLVRGRRGFGLHETWEVEISAFSRRGDEFASVCLETGDYRGGEDSVDRL